MGAVKNAAKGMLGHAEESEEVDEWKFSEKTIHW